MTIHPVSSASLPAAVSAETSHAATKMARTPHAEVLVNGRLASLTGSLDTIPAIRPEVIALGRTLAADPNYPGPVILERLASLFVADALS